MPMEYPVPDPLDVEQGNIDLLSSRGASINKADSGNKFALRFDDGIASQYEQAFKILSEYGFTGTLFPVTKAIQDGSWANVNTSHSEPPLTVEQIKEMAKAGWEIGCHTHTHTDLTGATESTIQSELENSISLIEQWTGKKPVSFVFPWDKYDALSWQGANNYFQFLNTARSHSDTTQNNDYPLEVKRTVPFGTFKQLPSKNRDNVRKQIRGAYHDVTQAEMEDLRDWALREGLHLCAISQLGRSSHALFREEWSGLPSQTEWYFDGTTTPLSESSEQTIFNRGTVVKYSGAKVNCSLRRDNLRGFIEGERNYAKLSGLFNVTTYNSGWIDVFVNIHDSLKQSIVGFPADRVPRIIEGATSGWEYKRAVFDIPNHPDREYFNVLVRFNNFDGTVYITNLHVNVGTEEGYSEGTATIPSGSTSVTVSHNLPITPAKKHIDVRNITGLGSATNFWVSNVTSTDFTISVDADPTQDVDFQYIIDCGWIPYNRTLTF